MSVCVRGPATQGGRSARLAPSRIRPVGTLLSFRNFPLLGGIDLDAARNRVGDMLFGDHADDVFRPWDATATYDKCHRSMPFARRVG